jgi:hypothetical protein
VFYTLRLLLFWKKEQKKNIYIFFVEQPPERSMLLFKATEKLNFRPLYFIEGINNISFLSSLEMLEFKASLYCV